MSSNNIGINWKRVRHEVLRAIATPIVAVVEWIERNHIAPRHLLLAAITLAMIGSFILRGLSTLVNDVNATDNGDTAIVQIETDRAQRERYAEEQLEAAKAAAYASAYNTLYAQFDTETKEAFCQMLFGEASIVTDPAEKAMHLCVVFNRLDTGVEWFGEDCFAIIAKPYQFVGYSSSNPVLDEDMALLEQVIDQWIRMQLGASADEVQWPIPRDILYWRMSDEYGHNDFYTLTDVLSGDVIEFGHEPLYHPYT